jgi:F420-non-reducing hydrogenase iron-sulfur subunit
MCSGRVDLKHVLRAFSRGMDGVFIGGCRLDECNYVTGGNYHALNMVLLCKKIMEHIGLNPRRLRLEFMSGGEGNLFTEVVDDFTREIKEIGPLGKSEGLDEAELAAKLEKVTRLVPYIKIMKNEKMEKHLEDPAEYETFFTIEEVEELLTEMISYYIDPEKCQACMICANRCPVGAIISAKKQVHIIEQDKCIRCGACFEACPPRFDAITKLAAGETVPPPPPEGEREIIKISKEKTG